MKLVTAEHLEDRDRLSDSVSAPPAERTATRAVRVFAARNLLGAAALLPLFVGTYLLSYWLRFDMLIPEAGMRTLARTLPWVLLVKLGFFGWYRLYRGWSRPVSFYDLVSLVKATTAALALVLVVDRLVMAQPSVPRSVFLIDWGATVVIVGGIRSVLRGFHEWPSLFSLEQKVPVLIVGAGAGGELVLRTILRNRETKYRVAGFIDDDPALLGSLVGGAPVIGTLAQTCQLADRHGVQQILVVQEELPGQQLRQLVEEARGYSIEVRVVPSYEHLIEGSMVLQPRPVSIDDLLHRDPIHLDLQAIRKWIDHRVLLVTGSAGSIGSEISRQLLRFSPERVVLVDRAETPQFFLAREVAKHSPGVQVDVCVADVLDKARMRQVFEQHRPHVVFHAAAYKHVPLMEDHPGEAVKNIVLATRRLADVAIEYGAESFVMISTDKAVNPSSVMGTCKRIAELYVQSLNGETGCRFVTVRFGNVLDSAGSVVPIFREQIARGGPVTITHPKMQRFFMTIPEAARLVIQAGAIGKGGQILALDMGEPVSIVDLATDMIRLSGFQPGREIAIDFVGLRPGEKLTEELLNTGENRVPTSHPKISLAEHRACDDQLISRQVAELEPLVHQPAEAILAKLQEIVPEYRRRSSAQREQRAAA